MELLTRPQHIIHLLPSMEMEEITEQVKVRAMDKDILQRLFMRRNGLMARRLLITLRLIKTENKYQAMSMDKVRDKLPATVKVVKVILTTLRDILPRLFMKRNG